MPLLATTAKLCVLDLIAQHDPQPNPELARRGDTRLPEALLLCLALVEALELRIASDGVNGRLVPPRDSAALIRAIEQLLDHPELRREFGECSRARAVARFDLSVVVAQTREHYLRLVARTTTETLAPATRPLSLVP